MRFGPVPVADALGAVLAHSVQLPDADGAGARRLPKGTTLTHDHLAAMVRAGLSDVWVARMDRDDVPEDAAAARLANALCRDGAGLRQTVAATGRVNLIATASGILGLDPAVITAVNRVDPGLTIATLRPYAPVALGTMVATIKIIPFAVSAAALDRACDVAGGAIRGAIRVLPPVLSRATLIETSVDGEGPPSKGRTVTAARLARFDVTLTPRVVVPHDVAPLARAIAEAPGELVLILTGSATSDSHDTAPQALRVAGGRVVHYGMPVDPGNLLFLGQYEQKPVIGLPGCARSPALNGADWVLERVVCGVPVTPADIADMGVGGLLKEISSRPRPRQP